MDYSPWFNKLTTNFTPSPSPPHPSPPTHPSPSEFVREDEEDSDWEYLGRADYYDAGSELSMSTPSYYSDYHSRCVRVCEGGEGSV